MREQQIQKKIKEWLESKGAYVTKYNANGYGVSGHSDLFASVPYISFCFALYIEVKTEDGKLRKVQELWIADMLQKGHMVCVARSIDDVKEYLLTKRIRL